MEKGHELTEHTNLQQNSIKLGRGPCGDAAMGRAQRAEEGCAREIVGEGVPEEVMWRQEA